MLRQSLRGAMLMAALVLAADASRGQPVGFDKVVVRDKKDGATKTYDGTIRLGPGGFQIVAANKKVLVTVAPGDLVKYTPGDLPGLERGIVLNLITAEEKGTKEEYEQARLGYADLRKKAAAGGSEAARRYVDYKYAFMATKVADESADDENWKELAEAATKAWSGFLLDYRTSWEVWPATRTNARLLAELNKHDEIARLWSRTAKTPGLPAALKLEADFRTLDAEIRGGGAANAVVAVAGLAKSIAPGAAKEKLAIYELAANAAANRDYPKGIKGIEAAIAATKDAAVRGVGYSMIGELHLLAGKPRDAMWAFLWVETVYSQDRDEVLTAMCRLVDAFRAQGDEDRAKSYRDKIRRYREGF